MSALSASSALSDIEQSCYWLATLPPHDPRVLEGAVEADVVIVGAGLTGLWTAIFLQALDSHLSTVVVERDLAASGASGRNAGMLSETVDHSHALAVRHFGETEARRLAGIGEANARELIAFTAERGIECEWEPTGRLVVALTPAQLEEARDTVAAAGRLGIGTFRWLEQEAVRAQVHSPLYLGGVAVEGGGILNPARLVDGLRREAERRGVRVYERSRVEALEPDGAGVRVRTRAGEVRARRAVLGTSAYTHHLIPQVTRRFIPLYDYILVSEPLTDGQRQAIGWRARQGVTDGRTFFNYYRLTRDDRVLWGTSEAAYYRGNRVDPACDHSPRHYEALRASWRRHFPALADLSWEYQWGGAICSTTRLTPFFGTALGGECTTDWVIPGTGWERRDWPVVSWRIARWIGITNCSTSRWPGRLRSPSLPNRSAPGRSTP